MEVLNIVQGKQTSTDYPYGSLRCTMTFDIEFKDKKGYRLVMQSTNPKNGRLNKPKTDTYMNYQYLTVEPETGHFKARGFSIHGYKDIQSFIDFLSVNKDIHFTDEESQYLWVHIISCIHGNLMYTKLKEGVSTEQVFSVLPVKAMVKAYGEHKTIYDIVNVGYDLKGFEELTAANKIY